MSLTLEIPDTVAHALRLPKAGRQNELLELAPPSTPAKSFLSARRASSPR